MAIDKSLNQFYQEFMEEIQRASDMETSGWEKDDFPKSASKPRLWRALQTCVCLLSTSQQLDEMFFSLP